jgi:predicted dehydrogenase
MSSRKARIGIVGAGFWSVYFYLPFFRANPDVELVGVVRRNRDALAALQREYELEVASPEVADLLAAGCDGVVVASPHRLHREHATAALQAGCHVVIEKPMTVTLADARAVEEEARRAGRTLTVAHGWNFQRQTGWAADTIASGAIGAPRWVTGVMSSSLVDLFSGASGYGTIEVGGYAFEAQAETWAEPGAGGGGYTYGQLSHELGVALALVPSDPTVVYARANFLPNGVDIDISVSVEFADGVVGSFSGHGRAPWGTRYPLEVRVAGENGVLALDFEADTARCWTGSSSATSEDFAGGEQAFRGKAPDLELELEPGAGLYTCDGPAQHLVDVCLGRPSVDRAPAELGRRAVAIMEGAVRSAKTGDAVKVATLEATPA